MSVKKLERIFLFDSKEIADPNPSFTESEVIKFLSGTYPSVINSKIESRIVNNDRLEITLSTSVGVKG